jgi:hypothetical protein
MAQTSFVGTKAIALMQRQITFGNSSRTRITIFVEAPS